MLQLNSSIEKYKNEISTKKIKKTQEDDSSDDDFENRVRPQLKPIKFTDVPKGVDMSIREGIDLNEDEKGRFFS